MSAAAPLIWAERSVWLASMLSANPLSYNAACTLAIDGALSTPRLTDALDRALNRSGLAALRVVVEKGALEWRAEDRRAAAPLIEESRSDPLNQLSEIFYAAPIKADSAPLLAVHVLKHRPDQHFVMLRHHHVLLDFQGAGALVNLAAAIYNGEDPPEVDNCRAALAAAENAYMNSDLYREDELYWRDRMRELQPGALSNPALAPKSAERIDLTISSQTFAGFTAAARAVGSTPFQSLLLIAYDHLQREQQGDVIFGVPIAGRAAGMSSQSRMLPFRLNLPHGSGGQEAAAAIRRALKVDIERARFPIWENTEAIFPGARRGALPKVALNFMRAQTVRFGEARATIASMLYGERNAETYIRCVEEADGRLLISLDSARDRPWVEGFSQALAAGVASRDL